MSSGNVSVHKSDVQVLKSMANPPQAIKDVLVATSLLLGNPKHSDPYRVCISPCIHVFNLVHLNEEVCLLKSQPNSKINTRGIQYVFLNGFFCELMYN